jgi:hypothetical protein
LKKRNEEDVERRRTTIRRPPIGVDENTKGRKRKPTVRGLPDREPGLGVRFQRIVALLGVFRHTQELRRARVVRAVDHDGQLERETVISDETRGERKHERVFAEEREYRETHAGEREVQFEMGGEVSREVEGESGRERRRPRRGREKEEEE